MKKIVTIFLTIILAAVTFIVMNGVPVFTSGRGIPVPPDGMVYGLQLGSTMYGIGQAMSDKPGTQVLIQETTQNLLFAWHIKDAAAFACLNGAGVSCAKDVYEILSQGGNVTNQRDMVSLIESLQQNGWKVITASEIPLEMRAMLTGAYFLQQIATSLPTILIVPAGIFNYVPYQTWKG